MTFVKELKTLTLVLLAIGSSLLTAPHCLLLLPTCCSSLPGKVDTICDWQDEQSTPESHVVRIDRDTGQNQRSTTIICSLFAHGWLTHYGLLSAHYWLTISSLLGLCRFAVSGLLGKVEHTASRSSAIGSLLAAHEWLPY